MQDGHLGEMLSIRFYRVSIHAAAAQTSYHHHGKEQPRKRMIPPYGWASSLRTGVLDAAPPGALLPGEVPASPNDTQLSLRLIR